MNRTLVRLIQPRKFGTPTLVPERRRSYDPIATYFHPRPEGAAAESLGIARVFLDSYRQAHPAAEIETFDLWDGPLPEFGPAAGGAKMAVFAGQTPTGAQATAWEGRDGNVSPV